MRVIGFILAFLFACLAYADDEHSHDGGCDKYPWDMNREWSLMITDPVPFEAAVKADPEWRRMPLDRRVQFKMRPTSQIKFEAKPGKEFPEAAYAGMAAMRVPFNARYRISSTKPAWIDVVGPDGLVPAAKSAMLMGCDVLVKTVIFKLDIEKDYWIQVSGGADPTVELLVTLDR